jgi:hypothetical protein
MNKAPLIKAALKFQREMQRLVDSNKSGITSISISSSMFDNKQEIVIAKKRDAKK